jgi:hypothetical protein
MVNILGQHRNIRRVAAGLTAAILTLTLSATMAATATTVENAAAGASVRAVNLRQVKHISIYPAPKYADYAIVRWASVAHAKRYKLTVWPAGHYKLRRSFWPKAGGTRYGLFRSDLPKAAKNGYQLAVTAYSGNSHGAAGHLVFSQSDIPRTIRTRSVKVAKDHVNKCVAGGGLALVGSKIVNVAVGVFGFGGGPVDPLADGGVLLTAGATFVVGCITAYIPLNRSIVTAHSRPDQLARAF